MNEELCKWLRENSSGAYRQCDVAADVIEELEKSKKEYRRALERLHRIASVELKHTRPDVLEQVRDLLEKNI